MSMAKSRKQSLQNTSRVVQGTSVLAAVSAILAACGGNNNGSSPPTPPPAAPTVTMKGTVTAAAFTPGSATEPMLAAGYYQGASVCIDANNNGKCDAGENPATTDAKGAFTLTVSAVGPIIADIGTSAVNTGTGGGTNPTRTVFRALLDQVNEQSANVIVSPLSTEVARLTEANGTDYATEKQNLATRLDVTLENILADVNTLSGSTQGSLLKESNILARRFAYAVTKLDRGDLYPDALAFPSGNPELTGMAGVTVATATVADTRKPITFAQAEQAAFNVEGIPRYDHIFIIMLENKATLSIMNSAFAPKINGYLQAGNMLTSYYATGNPSEPNYTALGGGDDFGITDDSQWNCDATGPNAVQDLPQPTSDQPGLASSPFAATCTQAVGVNHNITGKPNLFNAIAAAGMTWRTYSESLNPGQDFRTDSVADPAVIAQDHVYQPGAVGGNGAVVGDPNLVLPLPAALYKTKHHPGMAYQNVRSAPEFKYSNRTLGGSQWQDALKNSTTYAIPAAYDFDQFGSDLVSGNVGNLNFVVPDQCDDMHGITVKGTDVATAASVTASDCGSVPNNVANATGGAIITRGDNYVDQVVKKIEASPLWNNPQKRVAIVMMFDEGSATSGFNSCCGWNVSNSTVANPLTQNADGTWSVDATVHNYSNGNRGHGQSIWGLLSNQANAPKGVSDSDSYSHFAFVRTLQDMFGLADPAVDASYMNRSKYTEKFIAQNILNLPEYAGSADTHFDSVRPTNHAFAIPASYTQKQSSDVSVKAQVGADGNQTNIWALSK
jgi:hypothetical protein